MLHLWLGALLGLLCFVGGGGGPHDAKARAADGLLLTGAALDALRALLERVCGCAEQRRRAAFLTAAEWLQLLGFGGASLAVTGAPSAAVFVSALAALVVVVRVKAVLALHCLVGFAFVTDFLFVTGPDAPAAAATDPVALACFLSRLLVEPLLDYQFGGSSVTERWQPLLGARRWGGRLLLPLVAAVDAAFLALAASRMPAAGQLYRMVGLGD